MLVKIFTGDLRIGLKDGLVEGDWDKGSEPRQCQLR